MQNFFRKVLIFGSVIIKNRAPNQIASICRLSEDVVKICRMYYVRQDNKEFFITRRIKQFLGAFAYHCSLPIVLWRCEAVYVLPSCNTELAPLHFWNRFFHRPIILDYYVSIYEWACLMQNFHLPNSKKGLMYQKLDKIALNSNYLIHYCNAEFQHIAELLGMSQKSFKYFKVPLGTDFHLSVDALKFPNHTTKTIFGWWGSSLPLHGLETIISGFEKLSETRNDFELHLLFINEDGVKKYESRAGTLPSHDWLSVIVGVTSGDGKLQQYINEKISVGFSHFGIGENCEYVYTNKVIEAMSLGRTSIISDCAGNYDYTENLSDYFYVCKSAASDIARAAASVLDNPEGRKLKEDRCKRLFEARYSSDAVSAHFEETLKVIYQDYLQSKTKA
jgi:glycosyltransferase involved in cell wall biosynthesis